MEKLLIFNQKGGVGKSTSVVNIAGCLSQKKKKVLVIDIDAQCTATSYLRTIEGDCENTLFDYIIEEAAKEDVIYNISFKKWSHRAHGYIPQETNISLVPSDKRFNAEVFRKEWNDYDFFKRFFTPDLEEKFDYCIFDCPGYISSLTESALRVCDYIIVPAFADMDSLVGYSDLIDTKNRIRTETDNTGLELLGVVFTSVQGSVNRQIIAYCKDQMGVETIFKSTIRRKTVALDARIVGKPISYYKPKDALSLDYIDLTNEFLDKIKAAKKGKK